MGAAISRGTKLMNKDRMKLIENTVTSGASVRKAMPQLRTAAGSAGQRIGDPG